MAAAQMGCCSSLLYGTALPARTFAKAKSTSLGLKVAQRTNQAEQVSSNSRIMLWTPTVLRVRMSIIGGTQPERKEPPHERTPPPLGRSHRN